MFCDIIIVLVFLKVCFVDGFRKFGRLLIIFLRWGVVCCMYVNCCVICGFGMIVGL